MDSRDLYLNRWTPNFDLEMDVPNTVQVWVRLPHLPLHLWGEESVNAIGNAVGKYIDRCEQKDNIHACARICVEVDLLKGLPEAIKIKVDQWTHIQKLDYEKIPFKCKVCHEYGHFANSCLKKVKHKNVEEKEPTWEHVKRKKPTNKLTTSNMYQSQEANETTFQPPAKVTPPDHTTPNPFEPLEDSFDPPSPRSPPSNPTSLARMSTPNPISYPPPPSVDCILARNKAKEIP